MLFNFVERTSISVERSFCTGKGLWLKLRGYFINEEFLSSYDNVYVSELVCHRVLMASGRDSKRTLFLALTRSLTKVTAIF
jgi:hypothetical protein